MAWGEIDMNAFVVWFDAVPNYTVDKKITLVAPDGSSVVYAPHTTSHRPTRRCTHTTGTPPRMPGSWLVHTQAAQ
jgi:hypothetical protein